MDFGCNGVAERGWVEWIRFKKGKFLTKIFFSVNVEWSSKKLWEMISADVKANKNKK